MRHILITGASSGFGAALARAYAAPDVMFTLCGRDVDRLNAVAGSCRDLGATAVICEFDLRNADTLGERVREFDQAAPIDTAIFSAGLGGTIPVHQTIESVSRALDIAAVNFTAVVVLATAVANFMAARRRGRIVMIGSIADTFPLPMAPTYCGAKAGLKMFAEALALRLECNNVTVTLVSPGFIDTPMSRQIDEPKPFMLTAEAAAAIVIRKIEAGAARIVIPWPFRIISTASHLVPRAITRFVMRRLQRPQANRL
jgi:short-subunit dehydrogenase